MTTTELETLNLIQPMDDTRREMYIGQGTHPLRGMRLHLRGLACRACGNLQRGVEAR